MVRAFSIWILFLSFLSAEDLDIVIKSFVDEKKYTVHSKLIDKVFSYKEDFYDGDRIDLLKVTNTLKENGLLDLFFENPVEIKVLFETKSNPVVVMNIVKNSLKTLGYYYFTTKSVKYEDGKFWWSIVFESEHAIDPTIFLVDLQKRGVVSFDIEMIEKSIWRYRVDVVAPNMLDSIKIVFEENLLIRKVLNDSWIEMPTSEAKKIRLKNVNRSKWYPYIVAYNRELQIVDIITNESGLESIEIGLPKEVKFLKVGDFYSDMNIKNGINVLLSREILEQF